MTQYGSTLKQKLCQYSTHFLYHFVDLLEYLLLSTHRVGIPCSFQFVQGILKEPSCIDIFNLIIMCFLLHWHWTHHYLFVKFHSLFKVYKTLDLTLKTNNVGGGDDDAWWIGDDDDDDDGGGGGGGVGGGLICCCCRRKPLHLNVATVYMLYIPAYSLLEQSFVEVCDSPFCLSDDVTIRNKLKPYNVLPSDVLLSVGDSEPLKTTQWSLEWNVVVVSFLGLKHLVWYERSTLKDPLFQNSRSPVGKVYWACKFGTQTGSLRPFNYFLQRYEEKSLCQILLLSLLHSYRHKYKYLLLLRHYYYVTVTNHRNC